MIRGDPEDGTAQDAARRPAGSLGAQGADVEDVFPGLAAGGDGTGAGAGAGAATAGAPGAAGGFNGCGDRGDYRRRSSPAAFQARGACRR